MVTNLTEFTQPKTPQTCCKLSILPDLLQLVNMLQQAFQFHQAICYLQTSYNLLKQLAASLLITSLDNQLGTSLLTTCNRLVITSCRKPCEHILISACCNKLLQDVNRLVEFGRFWLCRIWEWDQRKVHSCVEHRDITDIS